MNRLPRLAALFLVVPVSVVPVSIAAQTASFTISQHGTLVGTAEVKFSASAAGFDSTSVVRVNMKGLNYAISKTEELSPANQLRHVQLSATVNNAAVNVSAGPEAGPAAGILVTVSAAGRTSTAHLAAHPSAVFLPDFDPGAYDTLLAVTAKSYGRDLWAILPKQSGAQAASVVPVRLATYADEHGTLDGKPVEVHHLVATIAGAHTELYSGAQNQVLQVELPTQGFAIVRKGFVLTPPAKAGAPPAAPPPQAGPQQSAPGARPSVAPRTAPPAYTTPQTPPPAPTPQ